MSAVDLYTKTLYEKYKYLANWLPNSHISLGDIGYITGNKFKKEKSLTDLGIKFTPIPGKNIIDDLSLHYKALIKFDAVGKADVALDETISVGSGNAKITFEDEGSFTFDALSCKTTGIANKGEVGEAIKELYKKNNNSWNKDWYVVDELVTAKSASIIVSLSKNSQIELGVNAKLPSFNLANPKASIKMKAQEGEIMKIIAEKSISPLFNTSKLKNSFLGGLLRSKKSLRFGGEVNKQTELANSSDIEYPFWERYELI